MMTIGADMAGTTQQVSDGELTMSNTLIVRPEHRRAYIHALQKVVPYARSLAGCLFLEVGGRSDSPGTFVLTERWRNGNEYVNDYLALPFYQEYLAKTEPMYAAPRNVVVLNAVPS
jgi:quinol monooxygenase YgiN